MATTHQTHLLRLARVAIILVALAAAAHTALHIVGKQAHAPRVGAADAAMVPVDANPPRLTPDQLEFQRLSAQIAMVCPSGARELNHQLAPPYSPTSNHVPAAPAARLTGARVAMADRPAASPPGQTWLVNPDDWFVPEDQVEFAPEAPAPSSTGNEPNAHSDPELNLEPGGAEEDPATDQGPPSATPPLPPVPTPPVALPAPLPTEEPSSSAPSPSDIAPPPVAPPSPAQPDAGSHSPFAPPPLGMPSPHGHAAPNPANTGQKYARPQDDPHYELLVSNQFPSAKACAKCHQKTYDEWSVSSHAYAFVSPMFHRFEQKINELSQGTVGYFCQRCHSPVSTALEIPRDTPLWEMPEVAREGVTCIVCHRVRQRYGKSNGERRVEPGDIYAPVYGSIGGDGVAAVIARKEEFKVQTSPDEKGPGQPIHNEGYYFDQLSASEFCASCHQVAVHPGIKLEVVWEQYRQSPAHKKGVTCQDCHMGREPGIPSGYETCAIAEMTGKTLRNDRKHSNHTFYGPGYSIAHPGVFPFHAKADRWTIDQWLAFDWRAGWGTEEFEDRVENGEIVVVFPDVWKEVDDRYDAREIIEENQKKLENKSVLRKKVMENGSHVDGPFFETQPRVGQELKLSYVVANTNEGHNLPTASLGAQPQLWANVVLIGPDGRRLWETGYTDQYGDVADIHSRDVRAGRVPFDSQLFNLQTMFLITGATGTDREFFLPVNVSFDQLPFLRPGAIPVSVTNHPPFIRMEQRSIAPLGKKNVKYRIPGHLLQQPGRYRLSFRMRSRAEPIYFMDFVGASLEMQRAMNEGMIDVHPYSVEFDVH